MRASAIYRLQAAKNLLLRAVLETTDGLTPLREIEALAHG